MNLHVLAYNLKRAVSVVGTPALVTATRRGASLFNSSGRANNLVQAKRVDPADDAVRCDKEPDSIGHPGSASGACTLSVGADRAD
jgi:hypothetical protein